MEIISSNLNNRFCELLAETEEIIYIVSPFIKSSQCEILAKYLSKDVTVKILTRFDIEAFRSSASNPEFVEILKKNFQEENLTIKINKKLHAKIYIFDNVKAIVSSANFTQGGFHDNIEYSVLIDDEESISKIVSDIDYKLNNSDDLDYVIENIIDDYEVPATNPVDIETIKNKINKVKDVLYNPTERIKSNSNLSDDNILFTFSGEPIKMGDKAKLFGNNGFEDEYIVVGYKQYELLYDNNKFELFLTEKGHNNYQYKLNKGDLILREFFHKQENRWISWKVRYDDIEKSDRTTINLNSSYVDSYTFNFNDLYFIYFDIWNQLEIVGMENQTINEWKPNIGVVETINNKSYSGISDIIDIFDDSSTKSFEFKGINSIGDLFNIKMENDASLTKHRLKLKLTSPKTGRTFHDIPLMVRVECNCVLLKSVTSSNEREVTMRQFLNPENK